MKQQIFNRSTYRLHRNRTSNVLNSCDFLLQLCAQDIISRLEIIDIDPTAILDLGARNGILTYELKKKYNDSNITALEVAEELLSQIEDATITQIVADDSDLTALSSNYDLVTSMLNMHWLNDILEFLNQISFILNDKGIFIGNFFGERTLASFRKKLIQIEELLSLPHIPHISPFIRIEDAVKLFQLSKFTTIIDIETVEVEYNNYKHLISDLRNMGETSKLSKMKHGMPRKLLHYLMNTQECITVNFDIITFVAFKNKQSLQIKD